MIYTRKMNRIGCDESHIAFGVHGAEGRAGAILYFNRVQPVALAIGWT